jgi:hypothetical protein
MNLAAGIARSALGERLLSAHQGRAYANEWRLTLAPFFTPETTEIPSKGKRSEPIEFSQWPVESEWIGP